MNMIKNFAVAIASGCALVLLSACGNDTPEGKWLDAPDAFSVYQATARVEAMESKSGAPDTSCEAVIGGARKMLDKPQTSGFKVMAKSCSNVGMAFAREIRCAEGSFQVKCE